jgi:hypothetical protein
MKGAGFVSWGWGWFTKYGLRFKIARFSRVIKLKGQNLLFDNQILINVT